MGLARLRTRDPLTSILLSTITHGSFQFAGSLFSVELVPLDLGLKIQD